jgi:hypothetical protein
MAFRANHSFTVGSYGRQLPNEYRETRLSSRKVPVAGDPPRQLSHEVRLAADFRSECRFQCTSLAHTQPMRARLRAAAAAVEEDLSPGARPPKRLLRPPILGCVVEPSLSDIFVKLPAHLRGI